jgi:hypothetical protein
MNLTTAERAAMVKDLQLIEEQYASKAAAELFNCGRTDKYLWLETMGENYESLASALKEGLNFEAVA